MSEETAISEAGRAPQPDTHHDDDAIIRIEGLVNRFGDHAVHDGLSLTMRRGEIIGVVGGSGTGKSVLMRSIIGLQQFSEGTIEVLGQNMGEAAMKTSTSAAAGACCSRAARCFPR
jgi:phospholipid/cholesterol/gamma-HCH transport system ATP-binding protein